MSKMTLTTEGDRHVIVTRHFNASPEAVYRAHTEPELIQKWLLGPEGWTMPVCINEARPGGRFRYEWSNGKGGHFYITGELVELEPNRKIVHIERMHLPDATPASNSARLVRLFDPGTRSSQRGGGAPGDTRITSAADTAVAFTAGPPDTRARRSARSRAPRRPRPRSTAPPLRSCGPRPGTAPCRGC